MRTFIVALFVAKLAWAAPPSQSCGGSLVLTLPLDSGGSFDIRMPLEKPHKVSDGYLVLHGEENGRGGWFLSVHRQTKKLGTDNLLPSFTGVDSKFDLDAMNIPYYSGYPKPLIIPITSTHRSLCIRWVNVRTHGTGAASSFLAGSLVEFRVLRNPE
jgi:hypothetical protein